LLPRAVIDLIPDAGHMVHHAAPERVVAAVDRIAASANTP
jgi:pimeloyl-ACP methyl ester carboxylesterase